jgi:hypothetical protein
VTGYPELASYGVTSAILATGLPGATITQGTQTVYIEPPGYKRLPNLNLMDIRFSKIFSIKERYKLQPEFDIYNLFNVGTVVSVNNSVTAGTATGGIGSVGSLYLNPTNVLPPRLFKVGLRFDF